MDLDTIKSELNDFYKQRSYYPINFSLPENKMLQTTTIVKNKALSSMIPGKPETYIYETESDYMQQYNESKFAYTFKKGGWDCLRHLEIMGAGCLPLFTDIKSCPKYCLYFYPKKLLEYVLDNVEQLDKDNQLYEKVLNEMYFHFRNYLTSEAMIKNIFYILDIQPTNILFIDDQIPHRPDYLSNFILLGLKSVYKSNCDVAFPVDYAYKNYPKDTKLLYTKGISYSKVLDDDCKSTNELEYNPNTIVDNIRNKKYDLIVYGSLMRSTSYIGEVLQHYNRENILGFVGEDRYQNSYNINPFFDKMKVFIREII